MSTTIKSLVAELDAARQAYYDGHPLMSDAEYDAKEDELRLMANLGDEADTKFAEAFFARVGAPVAPSKGWAKYTHKMHMGSLNKVQTEEEAASWFESCHDEGYILSEKVDGISIALYYEDGYLTEAVTRGDGDVGEAITQNVIKMKGVRQIVPGFTGCIRGEIVLKTDDWKTHIPALLNPRNGAAGIAKREDGVGAEHLTVLHYKFVKDGQPLAKSIEFKALDRLGLPTPEWYAVPHLKAAKQIYDIYEGGKRDKVDYEIDGLVIEANDYKVAEELGEHGGRPKYAVAWKFSHREAETILRTVEWQVGKSGRITPVAVFDPVVVSGAVLERASLAGVKQVQHLKLYVGCTIKVARRNDVIPRVERNVSLGINNL